ncbi:hypothetical protein, partial [Cryobacterium sp. Hh7]|uniref:hypothetical protein n=1 Tax=Cryobacterium sp. Hh7 TaxID=1259159 RepID=UPI00141ACF80
KAVADPDGTVHWTSPAGKHYATDPATRIRPHLQQTETPAPPPPDPPAPLPPVEPRSDPWNSDWNGSWNTDGTNPKPF